ncbi:trigger factor [Sulfurovum sp.]|uniref:trigger factor n=1 Tax=Sulfurovum sp. TaxID=1969726 RepID=UPI00286817BE|nr:trigger factor [Sulfurovum sp.]
MKVTVEKLDDINMIISGTVDDKMTQEQAAKLKEQAAIKTKNEETTDTKVAQTNDDTFQQEAESEILKEFIQAGLKEANIDIENILGQPGFKKYEKRGNGIYLEIQISTNPEIDTSVNYKDAVPAFDKPKADPKKVEAKLLEMVVQQAPFTAIQNARAVTHGDVAVIDFEGFVDGVAFEGGMAEKFNLKIGSNSFIPGFEEQVIGMQYNEEKTIALTFPKEYQSKDLAGKETEFKVKLHEIQEQKAIEPDNAFAKKILNDEKATLETLKGKLADQITSESLSQLYYDELKPKLINALLNKFEFTLPNNIVEQEIDAKTYEKIQQMNENEKAIYNKNKEKFHALRDSVREDAEKTIKAALIVDALAKKEGVVVNEQEVLSALYFQAMMSGQDAQELVAYYTENNLMTSAKMRLTEDKLFGQMLGFNQ